MSRPRFLSFAVVSFVFLVTSAAHGSAPLGGQAAVPAQAAPVPALVHFQGRLADGAGVPLPDADLDLTFRLYASSTGGAPLWEESKTVGVAGGGFATLLGDTTPLDPGLAARSSLWLGVSVGTEPELAPRYRLSSAPYAFRSADADALGGVPASGYAVLAHDHDDRYVNVDGDRMLADLPRSPVLDVVNAGDGYALSGQSATNIGVFGASGSGAGLVGIRGLTGVYGSGESTGVVGAGRETGVEGRATSGSGDATGVRGRGTIGVWGESETGTAVHGDGGQYGLYGRSQDGIGVFGVSDTAYGVHARSDEAPALYATSPVTGVVGVGGMSGAGVHGEARGGVGLWGEGDAGVLGKGQVGVHGQGLVGVQGRGQQQGVLGTSELLTGVGVLGRDAVGTGVRGEGHGGVVGIGSGAAGVSGVGSPGVRGSSETAEGVVGESTIGAGVMGTGRPGVHGRASASDDIGVYGENAAGVAVFGAGDVAQTLAADGLVKAAVYAYCDAATARIERSFSQVRDASGAPSAIKIVRGKETGDCSIDFGFDVSGRFVQATAVSTSLAREPMGVTVRSTGATTDVLGFFRWSAAGAGTAGHIFVLVY